MPPKLDAVPNKNEFALIARLHCLAHETKGVAFVSESLGRAGVAGRTARHATQRVGLPARIRNGQRGNCRRKRPTNTAAHHPCRYRKFLRPGRTGNAGDKIQQRPVRPVSTRRKADRQGSGGRPADIAIAPKTAGQATQPANTAALIFPVADFGQPAIPPTKPVIKETVPHAGRSAAHQIRSSQSFS